MFLKSAIAKTFKTLSDLIMPADCIFCSAPGNLVCGDCRHLFDIHPVHRPYRGEKLQDLYAAASYDNRFVKETIAKFKYDPFLKNLKIPLAAAICDHFDLIEDKPDFSNHYLAAVPLSKKRLRWRGFNQAEELAKPLSLALQIPLLPNLLEKNRHSSPQATLSAEERKKNIKGTFRCVNTGLVKGKKILLVDDITTTGATMEECAAVLIENGALAVTGLAAARTPIG